MIIRVKLLLLSFGVGLSAARKFPSTTDASSECPGCVTVTLEQTPVTEPQLTPKENGTIQNVNSNKSLKNSISRLNNQGSSNKNITEILRKSNTCRERHFKVSNGSVSLKQQNGSTHRIKTGFGRNSNITIFHCNISKELVDGLKDKLHELEFFQDIIVLYPKNRSSNADHLSAPKAQPEIKKYHKNFLPKRGYKNLTGRRKERDALLKNDQIESNTKVQQISHIYLGRSLYPLFTEESRIIGKDHTLPPPKYTQRTDSYR